MIFDPKMTNVGKNPLYEKIGGGGFRSPQGGQKMETAEGGLLDQLFKGGAAILAPREGQSTAEGQRAYRERVFSDSKMTNVFPPICDKCHFFPICDKSHIFLMLIPLCTYLPVKWRGDDSVYRGSPSGVSETEISAKLPGRQRRGQAQVVLRSSRRDLREGVRKSSARDRLLQS